MGIRLKFNKTGGRGLSIFVRSVHESMDLGPNTYMIISRREDKDIFARLLDVKTCDEINLPRYEDATVRLAFYPKDRIVRAAAVPGRLGSHEHCRGHLRANQGRH
jgi:hypothetical protein